MSRPLRIEFEGAFYHVHTRGNQKQPIFLCDEDRFFFLKCLREAHEKFGIVIHVYCLMLNHYHLFLETPFGGLSKAMHLINTSYSIYFNKKHGRCGHPFQGRYSAILVQADAYARELAPYIHLNPVRAAIVRIPEEYSWSNYRDYLGLVPPRPWTSTSFVLSLFSSNEEEARRRYAEHVSMRMRQGIKNPLREAASTGILGDPAFVDRVRKMLPPAEPVQSSREIPQLRRLKRKPALKTILAASEVFFGDKNRFARDATIYIAHKNTDSSLVEIAAFFELSISGISSIYRRTRRELEGNGTLGQVVRQVEISLFGEEAQEGSGLLSAKKSVKK